MSIYHRRALFPFPGHLAIHLTEIGKQGFSCKLCGKFGKVKSNMMRHVQSIHIRSSTYLCKMCSHASVNESNRQIHYRNVHNLRISLKELRDMDLNDTKPQ